MAVDISGKEYNGNIYIVWSNVGVPGINSGNDVDVYMARSEDQGATWSIPVRVNQDPSGLGRKHYFPWITCDPETGILSVVFYDDRNVGGLDCEVYCSNSYDGGMTWEDFRVSDVAFTPTPIPGLASGYMGDYIGINARGGWVYPTWADTRTGSVMTYTSPFQTNPLERPRNLTAEVTFETGITSLQWTYEETPGFSYFMIYRGSELIGTATDTLYTDQLPDYGVFTYKVSAFYDGAGESNTSNASVQWGDAQISVSPSEIVETLQPDSSVTRYVTINNIGQLEMNYNLTLFMPSEPADNGRDYCPAYGTCDEYISRVELNEIDNASSCTQYGDYTGIGTLMSVGSSYTIKVTNGNPIYSDDKCGLWIDWNQNQVFDDEESIPMNGSPGVGPYTATISPPVGAKSGNTRLRTRIVYYGEPTPCDGTTYGEVEDYTVFVQSWLIVDPTSGNILPGGSMQIEVTLSATDLDLGTYTAELQIYSNDPDDPQIVVPITLNVVDMAVFVSADQDTICNVESVQLSSSIIGGSGNYTYSWTSVPEGFTSDEANPIVTPAETMTYVLQVSDELLIVEDQLTIHVNPLPTIDLGADATICSGTSATFSAGEGYASYLWSTGDTTSSITTTDGGTYWVEVSNEFGCFTSDSVIVTVKEFPGKPVITSGPATVDNYVSTSSTYICDETSNALNYVWSIVPAEAGITSSSSNTALIDWAAGTTGSVQVSVTAQNDCGAGVTSEVFYTEIYSSQGLPENTISKMVIYPNPGQGLFTIRIPSSIDFKADVKVTDAAGAAVYRAADVIFPVNGQYELNLSGLADGIYSLQVSSKENTYQSKLIIQHN